MHLVRCDLRGLPCHAVAIDRETGWRNDGVNSDNTNYTPLEQINTFM
jgi:hypothetical protein